MGTYTEGSCAEDGHGEDVAPRDLDPVDHERYQTLPHDRVTATFLGRRGRRIVTGVASVEGQHGEA